MRSPNLREVLALMQEEGLAPSRALGQNFLVDANLASKIARLGELDGQSRVVEIGAGLGALTAALMKDASEVVAVELDRGLAAVLRKRVADAGATSVRVVEADALRLNWDEVLGTEPGWVLMANLPYNISTPLVLKLLEQVPQISRMVIMVQAEAGERLIARPGTAAYGAVSVRVEYFALGSIAGRVPPDVFYPRPKVDSVLVRLQRRERYGCDESVDYRDLERLVKAGFAHRRKMLRGALKAEVPAEALAQCGIRPESRAEELTLDSWCRLAAWRAVP